jgi:outer membrane protein
MRHCWPLSTAHHLSGSRWFLAIAAGVACSIGLSANAQTLVESLSAVYMSHPTLLAARASLRATDEGVPQALAGWRPTVSVTGGLGTNDVRNRSRISQPGFDFSAYNSLNTSPANAAVVLSQPIYQGGRTVASTRRAEALVLAGRARLLATEQSVFYDAVVAYVGVVRDAELLRLNDNNLSVLEQQSTTTDRRLRAGEVTRTDALQAESRLASAQGTRAAAAGALAASRAAFERAIGMQAGKLTAPQPLRPAAPTLVALGAAAAAENPAVVAALFDDRAARDSIDIQFSQLLPQLSLQGQVFRNDNAAARGSRTTGQAVTASLSVPIYQGGAEYSSVRQARDVAQQTRRLLDDQRLIAMQLAATAWEGGVAARTQIETSRRAIRAYDAALDGVQREALLGSRTTLDVLNAELELLAARTALIRAAADAVTTSYAAAASVGRLTAADLRLPVAYYDWDVHYRDVRNRLVGLGD